MKRPQNLIGNREAEERLGKPNLRAFVERDVLRPTKLGRSGPMYDGNDVEVLAELLGTSLDLQLVAGTAKLAEFRARRAERLILQLMDMLGVNTPTVSLGYRELTALYYKAEDDLMREPNFEPREIREWSKLFYALGEEHFEALALYLSEPAPYKVFTDLAMKLRRAYTSLTNSSGAEAAAEYLAAAGRCVRQTAFFYLHGRVGYVEARHILGKAEPDLDREIIDLMFARSQKEP